MLELISHGTPAVAMRGTDRLLALVAKHCKQESSVSLAELQRYHAADEARDMVQRHRDVGLAHEREQAPEGLGPSVINAA